MHGAALKTRKRACVWQLQDASCECLCSHNSIRDWKAGSGGAAAVLERVGMLRAAGHQCHHPWLWCGPTQSQGRSEVHAVCTMAPGLKLQRGGHPSLE